MDSITDDGISDERLQEMEQWLAMWNDLLEAPRQCDVIEELLREVRRPRAENANLVQAVNR